MRATVRGRQRGFPSLPGESPAHNAGYDISLHLSLLSVHGPTARLVFLNHFDFLDQSTHETLHAEHKTSLLKMNLKLNQLVCEIFFCAKRGTRLPLGRHSSSPCRLGTGLPSFSRREMSTFRQGRPLPSWPHLLLRLCACPPRFPSTRPWCCCWGRPLSWW